jgi:hypothetical protein
LQLDPAPPNKNEPAQQDQWEASAPTTLASTPSKKPPTPPPVAPNPPTEELCLKPKAITQDQPANHPIFNMWKTVKNKGKQSADTLAPAKSKRNAQRKTPTKIKERKEMPKVQNPIPIKKKTTIYNPYKKQDAHEMVHTNRSRNWQQCLNAPAHWGEGQIMEFPYTPPSPLGPALPATEAKHGF